MSMDWLLPTGAPQVQHDCISSMRRHDVDESSTCSVTLSCSFCPRTNSIRCVPSRSPVRMHVPRVEAAPPGACRWRRTSMWFAQSRSRRTHCHVLTDDWRCLPCVLAGCGRAGAPSRGRAHDARRRAAPCSYLQRRLTHVSPSVDGAQVYAVVAVAWPRVGSVVTGGGIPDSRVAEAVSGGRVAP